MARVVQRRPNPPYLLILFVFLFLVSTTLAVLFYTRQSDAREEVAEIEEKLAKIAESSDLKKGYVKERTASDGTGGGVEYREESGEVDPEKERRWAEAQSVITRLDAHLEDLAEEIAPDVQRGEDANPIDLFWASYNRVQAAQRYVKKRATVGLVGREALDDEIQVTAPASVSAGGSFALDWANLQIDEKGQGDELPWTGWKGVLEELQFAYEQRFEPQRRIAEKLKLQLAAARADKSDLNEKLVQRAEELQGVKAAREQLAAELATTKEELTSVRNDLAHQRSLAEQRQTQLGEKQAKLEALDKELTAESKRAEELDTALKRLRDEMRRKEIWTRLKWIRMRPDGEITGFTEEGNACYINIGLDEGVPDRMTFPVFPASGIPRPPDPKGKIEVIRVLDGSTSVCRIVEQDPENPIGEGDLIASVAFDEARDYKFVVAGRFDLYNTGRVSSADREEVKMLVRRFGGTVVDEVTPQVDYLVLGQRPAAPQRPDAPTPEEEDRYRQRKQEYDRYIQVKEKAESFGIWVLSTNRFLDLVGYSPRRTVRRP